MTQIAVIGLPQSGKTALTQALQALAEQGAHDVQFVEIHNSDELHGHTYEVVLQVVDSTRLEDSLLLTPHIIDEEQKIVLAIGRYDLLLQTDHSLNLTLLQQLIGVPMGLVSVKKNMGLEACLALVLREIEQKEPSAHPIYHLEGMDSDDAYRAYVHGVLTQTLKHSKNDQHQTRLERIDKVLTSPWTGFPIMIAVLYLVFWCTFTIGAYPQEWIANGIEHLTALGHANWESTWWTSVLLDGILQGVGAVLAFLPNIIILFCFISIMETSGYMAREAYLMDHIMHRVGLHGRSFLPMLMGLGCNVPAIMAARDIKNPKDRTLTMLMVPFISCSARLPVYMLFVDTFFERYKALVMVSLYAIGILIAILFAIVMKRTKWFKQKSSDHVNELPEFRMPKLKRVAAHVWERAEDYLQKIGTVIVWASIIIWALQYFPQQDLSDIEHSYLAMIGQAIEPIMTPLGFDWKMSVCLLTGLPAKEAIVSTMGILYPSDSALSAFTPVTAYAFMTFVLLYFPCVATITTLGKELGAKWAWFSLIQSMILAWVVSFLIYQVGTLFIH